LNKKGASQDKDKDKTKRKNDSPDPLQSPFPCEADEARQLDGSDIQALAIKEEDLQKVCFCVYYVIFGCR
jgi:hypothetical protein